jgi:hypothetical protein
VCDYIYCVTYDLRVYSTTADQPSTQQKPKMETTRRPHLKSLAHRGKIQGVTISTLSSPTSHAKDLCHYFGGVRYGLAPRRTLAPCPALTCVLQLWERRRTGPL